MILFCSVPASVGKCSLPVPHLPDTSSYGALLIFSLKPSKVGKESSHSFYGRI